MTQATGLRMDWRARRRASSVAALVHRLSGIALSAFLPLHFWVLSRALHGDAALDEFIRWTDRPLVKVSEVALVALLSLHLAGGLRILWLEMMPWSGPRKDMLAAALAIAVGVALAFALALGG